MQKIEGSQTLLLHPDATPTKLGIAQTGVTVYPVSPCCLQSYQKDHNGNARCNGCRKVSSLLSSFATQAAITKDPTRFSFFVAFWTGLSAEDFELEVS